MQLFSIHLNHFYHLKILWILRALCLSSWISWNVQSKQTANKLCQLWDVFYNLNQCVLCLSVCLKCRFFSLDKQMFQGINCSVNQCSSRVKTLMIRLRILKRAKLRTNLLCDLNVKIILGLSIINNLLKNITCIRRTCVKEKCLHKHLKQQLWIANKFGLVLIPKRMLMRWRKIENLTLF